MIASRFWFILLGLVLGAFAVSLDLTISMHDRLGLRMVSEGLSSDSRVVSWYLNDSARQGASQLIRFSADNAFARALSSSNSGAGKGSASSRKALTRVLGRIAGRIPAAKKFDAVLAVNRSGRVVGRVGFKEAASLSSFELGGYPLVADALHGHIRDDTLVLGRLYRMVARPVVAASGELPVGAVIGVRRVDDAFAQRLSADTNVAVSFFANGRRQGVGAPEGFERTGLDQIVTDLSSLSDDEDYAKVGRTGVHSLPDGLSVVYAKLPGEAWQLGAGYAVVRKAAFVGGVAGVLGHADEKDKKSVQSWLVALIALGAAGIGLALVGWEYSAPLASFRRHIKGVSSGETRLVPAEKLRGPFRQLGLDLNLALDRSQSDSDAPVSIALQDVLGDSAERPQMSAFGLPEAAPAPVQQAVSAPNAVPQPAALPQPAFSAGQVGGLVSSPEEDIEEGWAEVYDEFVRIKRECGENVQGFTFERFSSTLRKNRDTLMQQHGVRRVHFSAYVKQGRAALKAKPVRS